MVQSPLQLLLGIHFLLGKQFSKLILCDKQLSDVGDLLTVHRINDLPRCKVYVIIVISLIIASRGALFQAL